MTATLNPHDVAVADAVTALGAFAGAALTLLTRWEDILEPTDDDPLTLTYPADALPFSFDEVYAALVQWHADAAKAIGRKGVGR